MASPVQLTVDLNEIIKKILATVKDARQFERDGSDMATEFRRQVSRTCFYDGIIKRQSFIDSEFVGDFQRAALVDDIQQVYQAWQNLDAFLGQPQSLTLRPGVTWPSTAPEQQSSRAVDSPWRGVFWALKGKSRAQRLLEKVKKSNEFLGSSINDVFRFQDQVRPVEATSVLASIDADSASTQSDNRLEGMAVAAHINRLAIQHDRTPSNMGLLKDSDFLDMDPQGALGPDSSLAWGSVPGGRPVLVEYVPSTDFFSDSVDRAVRLAMLLNQSRVEGFGVLPCIGISENKLARRFEFIFDVADTGISKSSNTTNDGGLNEGRAVPSGFLSLYSQLSKSGIMRHYSVKDARPHKSMSISQRLRLAVSLAKTMHHLHQADWVHGNLNSRNIYFMHQPRESVIPGALPTIQIETLACFGFQFARLTNDYSDRAMWALLPPKDNFYRHPDRQIKKASGPKKPHFPHHDIYSLGVVLLEIGLGKPADELIWLAQKMAGGGMEEAASRMTDLESTVEQAQLVFVALAERALPAVMGDSYADIVRMCLSGEVQRLDGQEADVQSCPDGDQEATVLSFRARVVEPLDRMLDALG